MSITPVKGHLILLVAPMASGKGCLVQHVMSTFPQVTMITSCTTREKRPGEKDGVDYHFITKPEFEEKISRGDFIEWAEFGGNLYGTLKEDLLVRLLRGEVVINEIDIQGVTQLLGILPREKCTLVYVDAGDWETLKARARARAPISEEELALRYERYIQERMYIDEADFVIKNNDGELDQAKEHMISIVKNIITKVAPSHNE